MLKIEAASGASGTRRAELLSNLSLTLDRLAVVFLVLSAITLLVALLPTLMGFWPVFAIAMVHLAIVGWCFRLAWRGHWHRQEVCVDADRLTLVDCSARGRVERSWPSSWVRIDVDRSGIDPRLFIGMHDERTEIGAFVPAEERLEAARWLRETLADCRTAASRRDDR
ncbi:DUF2244 domain-containing protein [Halomonas denitrificans]|nr:DUF2244 domain-containing protein [Halomonas denitrificans]